MFCTRLWGYRFRSAFATHEYSAARDVIERASARHLELTVENRVGIANGALRFERVELDDVFQITAWFTPLDVAAQPAIVPTLLIATAMLALTSLGLSLKMPPSGAQDVATIEPEAGSRLAPTTVPLALIAVA